MRVSSYGLVIVLSLSACQVDEPGSPDGIAPAAANAAEDAKGDNARGAAFRNCTARFNPAPAGGWRHSTSKWIATLGSPVHAASDVVVAPGGNAAVQAHLGYGSVLDKDLEDEWVWVFAHDCSAWRYLGYARSNDDGEVAFTVRSPLAPGVYDLRIEVVGDTTSLLSRLWVLPSGTHVSVFDIDGTLTTSDSELYSEILTGSDPDPWPGAADLTRAEDSRNEIIVYLTGRPWMLSAVSRSWLDRKGFAQGVVRLASSASQVVPQNSGVGSYKAAFLASLKGGGALVDDAFGNATTDIYAYARAGVPTSRTWIIGSHAGEGGTRGVRNSWSATAAAIAAEPAVKQPGW